MNVIKVMLFREVSVGGDGAKAGISCVSLITTLATRVRTNTGDVLGFQNQIFHFREERMMLMRMMSKMLRVSLKKSRRVEPRIQATVQGMQRC